MAEGYEYERPPELGGLPKNYGDPIVDKYGRIVPDAYRTLLVKWLNELFWSGAITEQQRRIYAIEGERALWYGVPPEQLPLYDMITEPSNLARKWDIRRRIAEKKAIEEREEERVKTLEQELWEAQPFYAKYPSAAVRMARGETPTALELAAMKPEEQEIARQMARTRAGQEYGWVDIPGVGVVQQIAPKEPREPEIPWEEMPSPEEAYYPYLEQMVGGRAGAMGRYFEPRLGRAYAEFERAHPGAREAWWRTLHTPQPDVAPETTDVRAALGMEFLGGREAYAAKYGQPTVAGQRALTEAGMAAGYGYEAPQVKPTDPWKSFMANYPFLEKYLAVPPQQRGFRPGRYAPQARWYV